ncbi:hypothetical protein MLD38_039671 [Melastoma candidum]|uniref:Uncharacterized protein n=1 Tax=Melastoma candidum TaxID=119954 RepID=A0ACB9L4I6_9MYRT|nr:hypothetical protein MLD38_039671 [Melastoma candidum]
MGSKRECTSLCNYLLRVQEQAELEHRIQAKILLFTDFEPQISDFGLATWLPEHWARHIVPHIEGTFKYFMHGLVNEKTDVDTYGVLLLELITGRRALDNSKKSLMTWRCHQYKNGLYCHGGLAPHQSVVRILKDDECLEQEKKLGQPSLQRMCSEELYASDDYNATEYLSNLEKYTQIVPGKPTNEQP